MKFCNTCSTAKPFDDFSKRAGVKDGRQSRCRACQSAYRSKNSDHISKRNAEYNLSKKEKAAIYHKQHYAANKEKITARHREWNEANPNYRAEYYAKNRDRFLAAARENYVEKREIKLEYQKQYYVENPEKVAATRFKRRARILGAEGSHTAADIKAIFEGQRGRCASCEKKLFMTGKKKYHVDHIKPLARGGSNSKENLQCLCPTCNHRKHAKDPFDWAKENGKLL